MVTIAVMVTLALVCTVAGAVVDDGAPWLLTVSMLLLMGAFAATRVKDVPGRHRSLRR